MPFYFECETCGRAQPFYPPRQDYGQVERSCMNCNEPGCSKCMPEDLCRNCAESEDTVMPFPSYMLEEPEDND